MTEATPFIRAIIAHPADDGPRLVYADWLDERGDPRGEFIRVQCELEPLRGKPCESFHQGASSCSCGHITELHTREQSILYDYGNFWVGELLHALAWERMVLIDGKDQPDPRYPLTGFRRGFVESLTCTWKEFRQYGQKLRPLTPLKTVTLTTGVRIQTRRPLAGPQVRLGGWTKWHDVPDGQGQIETALAAEFPEITFARQVDGNQYLVTLEAGQVIRQGDRVMVGNHGRAMTAQFLRDQPIVGVAVENSRDDGTVLVRML